MARRYCVHSTQCLERVECYPYPLLQLLAEALDKCVSNCEQSGAPFALEVFVAGRNRLEIDGSVALAAVFRKFKSLKVHTHDMDY